MSHGLTTVRLFVMHCHSLTALINSVSFNHAALLMPSFINFQGQVLVLFRVTLAFSIMLITWLHFLAKDQSLGLWEVCRGSDDLLQTQTLALLMISCKCHTFIRSCILSLQSFYNVLYSWYTYHLWHFDMLHSSSESCCASVWGYKVAFASPVPELKLHSSLATCHRQESKDTFWYAELYKPLQH